MFVAPSTTEPGWRPTTIIFDLLTGLIDSWALWDASTPSGTPEEGRPWRERYLKLTFGAGAYVPYEDLVRAAARDVGLPASAPEALLRDWEGLQAWPEAATVLRALRENGYRLGVSTNCSKRLGHLAARAVEKAVSGASNKDNENANNNSTSTEDFVFDTVVTAEESGFYKPVKPAYEAVLAKMGVESGEVLFVAGSAGDVQGATDAGMRVVWHNKVGLTKVGGAVALREGKTLDDALRDFL
ncbi:HAD-like domain-containing protein [Xylariales sp. PMI_506]|nr:HAD-like domain-containing protein [Xylariales sp. PMI_506]